MARGWRAPKTTIDGNSALRMKRVFAKNRRRVFVSQAVDRFWETFRNSTPPHVFAPDLSRAERCPPSVGRRVLLNHKTLSCLYLQGNKITTIRELAKLSRLPG